MQFQQRQAGPVVCLHCDVGSGAGDPGPTPALEKGGAVKMLHHLKT